MKKQQKMVMATLLLVGFSLCKMNTAGAVGNRPHDTSLFSEQLFNVTQQYNDGPRLVTAQEQKSGRDSHSLDNSDSRVSHGYWTKAKELFSSLYDSIRIKIRDDNSSREPKLDLIPSDYEQEPEEKYLNFMQDLHGNNKRAQRPDHRTTPMDLDGKWILPLSTTCRIYSGIGYLQQTFQQKGRIYGSSKSSESFGSSFPTITQFDTTYHLLLPQFGLEKQMSSKAKLTAVMKIPAYTWTEYEADDPEIERFNPASGDTGIAEEQGVHGEISLNRKMSKTITLSVALSYSVINSSNTGLNPKHDPATTGSQDSGEHMGAVLSLGAAL